MNWRRSARSHRRWVVLSDGASPTEDTYFMAASASWLKKQHGVSVRRLEARRDLRESARSRRRLRGANVLICRSLAPEWLAFLEDYREQLGSIHYLVDDDLAAADGNYALPEDYRERLRSVAREQQPRIFALADEVIAASETLGNRLGRYHDNVTLLTPPLIADPPGVAHFGDDQWRIGYHGTGAHREDLRQIAPAIQRLHDDAHCRRGRSFVFELMLGWHTPAQLRELPGVESVPALSWPDFDRYRRQQRVHIGLAPLWGTAFNCSKSFIKFLDITVMGGVGIYSRRSPYADVVDHGVDGLLAGDDPDEWYDCMCQLVDDAERTRRMALAAADKAREIGDVSRVHQFWLARS